MTLSSHLEIERKYDADLDTPTPDFSQVPGLTLSATHAPVRLRAVYYDTDDLTLARNRIALRRREGGADEGWHLKLPGELGRTELQARLTHGDRLPGELRDTVEVFLRGRPVIPIARIDTERTARELSDSAGRVRVEFVDDRVSGTDLRDDTTRAWREWEAEVVGDDPEEAGTALLDLTEPTILRAGGRVSGSSSKLAHTLGADRLGRDIEAEGHLETVLTSQPGRLSRLSRALQTCDPQVRRDEDDSAHRMRTIARRLRNLLGADGSVSRNPDSGVRDELQRLGAVLGEVRDLEVRLSLADRMAEVRGLDAARDLAVLTEGTRSEYALARTRIVEYLNGTAYFELLDALDEWGADREPSDAELMRRTRVAARESLAQAAEVAESGAGARLADLHRLRKSARRLRYLAEALSEPPATEATGYGGAPGGVPVEVPEGTQRAATAGLSRADALAQSAVAARGVQETLGEHRDLILLEDSVRLAGETVRRAGGIGRAYDAIAQAAGEAAAARLLDLTESFGRLEQAIDGLPLIERDEA